MDRSVDELLATDLSALGDEAARQHVLALHAAKRRLDAATIVAAGMVESRGLHQADAARSCAGWLAARVDQGRGRCGADVRLARALADTPIVEAAALAGRLGRPKVEALVEARTPEVAALFAEHEPWLVEEVERLTVVDAQRFLRAWHEQARLAVGAVDPDEPVVETAPRVAVDLAATFQGRWVLAGEMDAEHGTLLRGAIDAEVDEMFRVGVFTADDGLAPAERRGLALAQVVARKARPATKHGAPRPSIEVICDERTLLGQPVTDPDDDDGDDLRSRVCQLVDGTPVSAATLGRLVCGADVHRLVTSAAGEVLDLGTDVRLASAAQRRALRHRHGGHCAWAGCTAPFDWCEVHHLIEWDHDGPTDRANLAPLCLLHHHRAHEGGYTLVIDADGQVTAVRPPDRGGGRHPVTPARAHRRPVEPHPDTLRARQRVRDLIGSRPDR